MRWLNRSIQCSFSLLDGAELSSAELVLHMHQVLDFGWCFSILHTETSKGISIMQQRKDMCRCVFALGLSGEILACAIEKSHGVYGGVVEEWMRLLFVKFEVRE